MSAKGVLRECMDLSQDSKKPPRERGLSDSAKAESPEDFSLRLSQSTDGGSLQSHRSGLDSSQVEGEVVSVALMHHFHAEAGTVQHISPGVQDAALTIKDGLVEVEAVQVEGHG